MPAIIFPKVGTARSDFVDIYLQIGLICGSVTLMPAIFTLTRLCQVVPGKNSDKSEFDDELVYTAFRPMKDCETHVKALIYAVLRAEIVYRLRRK